MSVEVAEHLPHEVADGFVKLLTDHADYVVFSAAIPHQGGSRHINEQWPDYWVSRFAQKGFILHDILRWCIWNDARVQPWYRQNILLFAKAGRPVVTPPTSVKPVRVVHPDFWLLAVDYSKTRDALCHHRSWLLVQELGSRLQRSLRHNAVVRLVRRGFRALCHPAAAIQYLRRRARK